MGAGCCGGGDAKKDEAPMENDRPAKGCCPPAAASNGGGCKSVETDKAKSGCCSQTVESIPTQPEEPACSPAKNVKDGCCSEGVCSSNIVEPIAPTPVDPEAAKDGKKGCCSKGKCSAKNPEPMVTAPIEPDRAACCQLKDDKDGCCSKQGCSKDAVPILPVSVEPKDVKDGCCSEGKCSSKNAEPTVPVLTEPQESACCAPKDGKDDCKKCNTACLERVALRECLSSSPGAEGHTANHPKDKACGYHARTAAEKYAEMLDALGCLCRTMIAMGQDSCCPPPVRSSLDRRRAAGSVKSFGSSTSSLISKRDGKAKAECCSSGSTTCIDTAAGACKSKIRARGGGGGKVRDGVPAAGGDGGGCCSKKSDGTVTCSSSAPVKKPTCKEKDVASAAGGGGGCCSKKSDGTVTCSSTVPAKKPDCVDDCCDGPATPDIVPRGLSISNLGGTDLEKGAAGETEHVVLSVAGMTCVGCEVKLKRALEPLPAVRNLKASLLMARTEFDLSTEVMSIEELFRYLQRTTTFKYDRIASSSGTTIDILAFPDEFIARDWPAGVTDMAAIGSSAVAVEFDPGVIGARDLVERGWGTPVTLAPLRGDPTLQAGSRHVWHLGLMTLLSTVLTIPVLVFSWAPLPDKHERERAFSIASLVLATIVQFAVAGPLYPQALKALIFSRVIEMELLVVLSTSAAYIFSLVAFGYLVAGTPLSTGEFFETGTLLVTLIMVGRWLTALARHKAVESISIRSLQASTTLLVDKEGDREIDTRLLQYGDVFKVVPDSKVPTDGTVIGGSSEVDESMITGESLPVEKNVQLGVIAGSINGSGTLTVRLTRLPGENTISTIASMVDEAKLTKPRIQDIADTVAGYFVPVILVITTIVFCIWVAVGIAVQGHPTSEAVIQAVIYAITVLIVSCPCAIGLAVPMVIVIASGVAAENGVIFKSAEAIEIGHRTSHVVFDKTGTLTEGKLTVVHEEYLTTAGTPDIDIIKSLIRGLLEGVKHPVSVAVSTHLKNLDISLASVTEVQALTGKGVEGTTPDSQIIRAGNSRWLDFSSHPLVTPILSSGHTAFCVTINDTLAAVFALADTVRPDAGKTIAALQKQNITIHMLSGDDDGAVRSAASALDIPDTNVRSRCTPAEKQAYIQTLLHPAPAPGLTQKPNSKTKTPVVIFCGDGTNDSVALTGATIGVHVSGGSGTDVAQAAADVVLVRPDVSGILKLIALSRKAHHRIVFNFGWSFVYNLFAILLASGAFVRVRIPPEFAGLGELASVLPVIAAGVMLKWARV